MFHSADSVAGLQAWSGSLNELAWLGELIGRRPKGCEEGNLAIRPSTPQTQFTLPHIDEDERSCNETK